MEATFNRLQEFINEFTAIHLKKAINLFEMKLNYWDNGVLRTHIKEEAYKASCELVDLQEKHPVLYFITSHENSKNVLWESVFIESLSPDEKRKYLNAEKISIDSEKLKNDITTYDKQLPYFSGILQSVYLKEFIYFLQSRLPQDDILESIKSKEKIVFETNFSKSQIDILTVCINEVRLFSEKITPDMLNDIFNCQLSYPLKTRNNRLLVYFFSALDDRSLITRNWQSVIDKNRLFLSSGKGNPLTQTDLSSANSEIKITSPKDSEIIDKYLKQLQKH